MGVSISIWRARIGCFHCSKFSKCKSKSYSKVIITSTGTYNSHLPVFVITLLLIIGCIETNPGPTVEELIMQVQTTLMGEINSSNAEGLKLHNTLLGEISSSKKETLDAVNLIKSTVDNISSQISDMNKSISDSNNRISKLENENSRLVSKIDQLENNIRKNNIIVFGLEEIENSDDSDSDVFINFGCDKLEVILSPFCLSNAYRMGQKTGKRPLFVQFAHYKNKIEVMKNVGKLKGTSVSISDDLTPTARAQKKLMLKCASDARKSGRNVKVRSNFIIVDDVTVQYSELKNPNWLQSLQLGEGSSASGERKR
jgi:hypothetical protein